MTVMALFKLVELALVQARYKRKRKKAGFRLTVQSHVKKKKHAINILRGHPNT